MAEIVRVGPFTVDSEAHTKILCCPEKGHPVEQTDQYRQYRELHCPFCDITAWVVYER